MSESKQHRRQVREALNDETLRTALRRSRAAYVKSRAEAMKGFDLAASREQVRSIKERCVRDLDTLFARFKAEAEAVGAVVHAAADGAEAAAIVRRLAEERGAKLIVKAKSMLTEELELNDRLGADLRVVETDLGEWIIQLAHEKPSHFTMPAMHKTREQIAELFSKVTGKEQDPEVAKLVEVARRELRQAFIDADMGVSGANVAIAETGTLVLVSNEGNARLVTTLPPIHVAIVGYEKLVETMEDATAILKVLSKSGTGQKQTAYVSFITGPSRTTDIEKTLALGVHGPKEVHIIFVDAGRKAMAADERCREALYCIKCGACLNMCPVYHSIGGHAYANAYMGGIGSVLTAYHKSLDAADDTLALCTGCGYCESICPAKINAPDLVLELKKRVVESHGMPLTGHLSLAMIRHPEFMRRTLTAARTFQPVVLDSEGLVRDLPVLSSLWGGKRMPGLASRFLSETLPERSSGTGKVTVALYAGCMLEYIYPEIGEAIWKVLERGGATAMFPREQACCGAPALYAGDFETAVKLAIANTTAVGKTRADHIVTGCPTCAVMLKERFPELLRGTEWEERAEALAARVVDFSQFASEVLDLNVAGAEGRVTYHDPCHQVRGLGSSACSRSLITHAGMDLVEMTDSDECCGFAGSYSIRQPGISESIMRRKIDHIGETEAGIVATDCPGCILQIRGGLAAQGSPIEVLHTAQLTARLLD